MEMHLFQFRLCLSLSHSLSLLVPLLCSSIVPSPIHITLCLSHYDSSCTHLDISPLPSQFL